MLNKRFAILAFSNIKTEILLGLTAFLILAGTARAENSDEFLEEFALSEKREQVLAKLVSGTEEWYSYHCLQAQNTGDLGKAESLIKAWAERHGESAGVIRMKNRQALLDYERTPRKTLDHLRDQFGLSFDHAKETALPPAEMPSRLDAALLSFEAFKTQALARHRDFGGVEPEALELFADGNLDVQRRRALLTRLPWPGIPGLAALVAADLKAQGGAFGSLNIHRILTLPELEELAKLMPQLLGNEAFLTTWLARLLPGAEDPDNDATRLAHLERLLAFARTLPASQNSLKAHALYHRLDAGRRQGDYDRALFLEYLKLPRRVHYILPLYLERHAAQAADLGHGYFEGTRLATIGDDEDLVRDYLDFFFAKGEGMEPFREWIEEVYLKEAYGEARLLHGLGEENEAAKLLDPEDLARLRERVEIKLIPANRRNFKAGEDVALELDIKNVPMLFVRIYELRTLQYGLDEKREPGLDLPVEGLRPNAERRVEYGDPPIRRQRRRFELPELKEPGDYLVEFVGGGMSSRALIRKGRIEVLERTGAAGPIFSVVDEAGALIKDAALWLGGRRFSTSEDGRIRVPFAQSQTQEVAVAEAGRLARLHTFTHLEEKYELKAAFHAERESLLAGRSAKLLVRADLRLCGRSVPLALLKDPVLTVEAMDHDDVASKREYPGIKLEEGRELVIELLVPARLRTLRTTLRARVRNVAKDADEDLVVSGEDALNGMDASEAVEDAHLARAEGGYVLHLLGKSGEPVKDRACRLSFKHRWFTDAIHVALKSDARGRVELGELKDIEKLTMEGAKGGNAEWGLLRWSPFPAVLNIVAGSKVTIPWGGPFEPRLALFENKAGVLFKAVADKAVARAGSIEIAGLEPGDYLLVVKDGQQRVALHIGREPAPTGLINGPARLLEPTPAPMRIAALEIQGEDLVLRLENQGEKARVHLFAVTFSGFLPDELVLPPGQWPAIFERDPVESLYESGVAVDAEARYILDRRLAKKWPGVSLPRPGLLLNPWSRRKTEIQKDSLQGGEGGLYPSRSKAGKINAMVKHGGRAVLAVGRTGYENLDFLARAAQVLENLKPEKDGTLRVKKADLAGYQLVRVLALDENGAAYREFALPEIPKLELRDQRLHPGLDPARHFLEDRRVSLLRPGDKLEIADVAGAGFEIYDDLRKLGKLYAALNVNDAPGNDTLREFSFIFEWPDLPRARQLELYSKYAGHELNFFLWRRDRKFFDEVVLPYLRNKKDKTFLDLWLSGGDLAAFRRDWAFSRLNAVEKVLLGWKIEEERQAGERWLREEVELHPTAPELLLRVFDTALNAGALEGAGGAEFQKEKGRRQEEGKKKDRALPMLAQRMMAPSATAMAGSAAPQMEGLADGEAPESAVQIVTWDEKASTAQEGKIKKLFDNFLDSQAQSDKLDLADRETQRAFYKKVPETEEWAENNYWHLRPEQQLAELVPASAFWLDLARHGKAEGFLSGNAGLAHRNFTEIMFALALVDLPFHAGEHKREFKDGAMTLIAASSAIAFHREIRPIEAEKDPVAGVLLQQNLFRHGEREVEEAGEMVARYATGELLARTVYGLEVVLTNPSAQRRRVDLLLQIPEGAVPVLKGYATRALPATLEPYTTARFETHFYFPVAGEYGHFPAHAAEKGRLAAFAPARALVVVDKPTKPDAESWNYVSQEGSGEEVLKYLESHNLRRVALGRLAFRLKERAFYGKLLDFLESQHAYERTLWSYSVHHDDAPRITAFLEREVGSGEIWGPVLDCKLLKLDPVERGLYEHLEYSPLIHARAHRGKLPLPNALAAAQVHRFLEVLSFRKDFRDADRLAAVYYLLLQDRVEEALKNFALLKPEALATRLQYDYCMSCLALAQGDAALAEKTAAPYKDYPVERWRKLFGSALEQIAEAQGGAPGEVQDRQERLAAAEPVLTLEAQGRKVMLAASGLGKVQLRYYPMDIEMLFSRQPFLLGSGARGFSFIRPAAVGVVEPQGAGLAEIAIPEDLARGNLMVEAEGAGLRRTLALTVHTLRVELIENYGRLRVLTEAGGKPVSAAYVKVYAREGGATPLDGRVNFEGGAERFYKDGYTDLRGVFDYASLSSGELGGVGRFAILVLSEEHGAKVLEAAPPKS